MEFLRKIKETYWHFLISLGIAAFIFFYGRPAEPEHFLHLFESILILGLTFIGFQLSAAERHSKESKKYLDEIKKLSAEVSLKITEGENRIAETNKALIKSILQVNNEIVEAKNSLINSSEIINKEQAKIDRQLDMVEKGINLSTKVTQGKPNVQYLFDVLERDDALKTSDEIINSFEDFVKTWSRKGEEMTLHAKSVNEKYPLGLFSVWQVLISKYLQEENKDLLTGRILTTSEIYTKMVVGFCDMLHKIYPNPDYTVTLFLVTTMLPDEFYNWPQVEYSLNNSSMVNFNHTWDGSGQYLKEMKALKDKVILKRRIIIKKDGRVTPSFVKEFKRLHDACNYFYLDNEIDYTQIKQWVIPELFKKITSQDYETADGISGINNFKFYLCADQNHINNLGIKTSSLLKNFIENLHSESGYARYYEISTDDDLIEQVFFANSSVLPEFAFFRIYGKEESSGEFQFALGGHLRPYTESIRLQFLYGNDLKKYQAAALELESQGFYLTDLIK